MQSKGAKEKVLTRIMVSRCEVDLMKIRREFKRHHKRSLFQAISVSFRDAPLVAMETTRRASPGAP